MSALDPSFELPHRRYNPLTDEWVLVSPGRTGRPWQGIWEPLGQEHRPAYDPDCYLCPGNARAEGTQNPAYTSTYVFDNDFPALRPSAERVEWSAGVMRAEGVPGRCRVLAFSPRHDLALAQLTPAEVRAVINAWADETETLGAEYRWVQIFENRGAAMGASSQHPHGQVWAIDAVPNLPAREDDTQRRHHERVGTSLLLDIASAEANGPRVVATDGEWVGIVPFWAVWPFETLLVPRRPVARLSGLTNAERDALARLLRRLIRGYDGLVGGPMPYSLGWHQAPFGAEAAHWQLHAHLLPPLLRSGQRKFLVGFELLAEPQRDLTPENAAERLRGATDLAGEV